MPTAVSLWTVKPTCLPVRRSHVLGVQEEALVAEQGVQQRARSFISGLDIKYVREDLSVYVRAANAKVVEEGKRAMNHALERGVAV